MKPHMTSLDTLCSKRSHCCEILGKAKGCKYLTHFCSSLYAKDLYGCARYRVGLCRASYKTYGHWHLYCCNKVSVCVFLIARKGAVNSASRCINMCSSFNCPCIVACSKHCR